MPKQLIEVPQYVMDSAAHILHKHTTALMAVEKRGEVITRADHLGSGTFVTVDNIYGVLTAQHVAEHLIDCDLGLSIDTKAHTFSIPSGAYRVHEIAEPLINDFGPDLAFIELPSNKLGVIKATMLFYNLSMRREIMREPPPTEDGAWIVCGTPVVGTRETGAERSFDSVKAYQHFALEARLSRNFVREGFDYVEFEIDYSRYKDVMIDFRGISGGGVWQLLLASTTKGIKINSYLLSGVNFFQTDLVNNRRSIRSHFRTSVYEYALNAIVSLPKMESTP